jgi:hypothetical protein
MQGSYPSPDVCARRWRTFTFRLPPPKAGRWSATGSSSASVPSSTNVMSVADVSHLLAEAIGITVVGVTSPNDASWSTAPSRTTTRAPPSSPSACTRARIDASSAANGSRLRSDAADAGTAHPGVDDAATATANAASTIRREPIARVWRGLRTDAGHCARLPPWHIE